MFLHMYCISNKFFRVSSSKSLSLVIVATSYHHGSVELPSKTSNGLKDRRGRRDQVRNLTAHSSFKSLLFVGLTVDWLPSLQGMALPWVEFSLNQENDEDNPKRQKVLIRLQSLDIYFHQGNIEEHEAAVSLRDAVLRLRRDGAFVAVPLFRINTAPIGPHPVGLFPSCSQYDLPFSEVSKRFLWDLGTLRNVLFCFFVSLYASG